MIYSKSEKYAHHPVAGAPHFTPWEFRCKCGMCRQIILDLRLPVMLEKMRTILGRPINIESGYRCPRYNALLIQDGQPASNVSKHIMGLAADIWVTKPNGQRLTGIELARIAYMTGFRSIGVAATWAHVDIRDTPRLRLWTYGALQLDLNWLKKHLESQ
jgi:hypothetical protein